MQLSMVSQRIGAGWTRIRMVIYGLMFCLWNPFCLSIALSQEWPVLPEQSGAVQIPAQEWPQRPGPRHVQILIYYPGDSLQHVTSETGIMLTLHNWGGTDCVGTADPVQLAEKLNVIAICVNYLQSGRVDAIDAHEPYDCGHLQALDALRGLWFVFNGLKVSGHEFADDRIFCTGGSGGGNVTLMANKLAPRTFACIIDMCGMKRLSDDIAFDLPGGSTLNARWSRDPASPNYLTIDEQQLRFVGHPGHLAEMKRVGAASRIVVVHGVDDVKCPFDDAVEMVESMRAAGLPVEPKFVSKTDLDGTIFSSSGHSLGDRTLIVIRQFGKYLMPAGEHICLRAGRTDFERGEAIRYRTTNGQFVVDYQNGFPASRFEPAANTQ